jgi:hypothetical protein
MVTFLWVVGLIPDLHSPTAVAGVFWYSAHRVLMGIAMGTYIFASVTNPGYVVIPGLEAYKSSLPPQTTGHVSLHEMSFDLKAKQFRLNPQVLNFEVMTLPSPKAPDAANNGSLLAAERFTVVDTFTPVIALQLEDIFDTSGQISERQVATGEFVRSVDISHTTKIRDKDESQAMPEEDDRSPTERYQVSPHVAPTTDNVILETRYCVVCNMEQPLRGKHCRDCNKCVSLHDHHCPWLGNCIGARNRLVFYWYLVAQSGELWMALLCMGFSLQGASSVGEWFVCNLMRLGVIGVLVFFTVMVTSLLVFHSFLAVSNLTTCEG